MAEVELCSLLNLFKKLSNLIVCPLDNEAYKVMFDFTLIYSDEKKKAIRDRKAKIRLLMSISL